MRETRIPIACGVRALHGSRESAIRDTLRPLVAALAISLCACASPSQHYADEALALGFAPGVLAGDPFRHVVYVAQADARGDSLHVYIEHDGTPWIDVGRVSDDPTPRTPFALELMAHDAGPRLFLGRPCYFETHGDDGCSKGMWTYRRYAPEVVQSMAAALRGYLAKHPFPRVVLIGYSGGGALAWLLASRIPQTTAVVTVAANLDVAAWTELHDYTPLAASLDPATQPPLASGIRQVNFVGGRDANVPPSIAFAFRRTHPRAEVIEIPEFDHRCCWIDRWPALLARLELARAAEPQH
jgi:pimeloyl-ACP methyl ester carboxylesterase